MDFIKIKIFCSSKYVLLREWKTSLGLGENTLGVSYRGLLINKKKRIYKENSVISQPAKFKNGHDLNRQVTNEDV